MPIQIHGKNYTTVAERIKLAHEAKTLKSVETEVLTHSPVVIRAKIVLQKGEDVETYTGISAVDSKSASFIEKNNPYEVAETSALGRALGFANYGLSEDIASADEMVKSGAVEGKPALAKVQAKLDEKFPPETGEEREMNDALAEAEARPEVKVCSAHDEPAPMYRGESKLKVDKDGNPKVYWWHKGPDGRMCFGDGYKD